MIIYAKLWILMAICYLKVFRGSWASRGSLVRGTSINCLKLKHISKFECTFFFFFRRKNIAFTQFSKGSLTPERLIITQTDMKINLFKSTFILFSELHQYYFENTVLCVVHIQRPIRTQLGQLSMSQKLSFSPTMGLSKE